MNKKLKEAFAQVHAEKKLKDSTKEFLLRKTNGYTKTKTVNYWYFFPAAVCFLLILFWGYWIYFTPTMEISIDINPSIELSVNRFDKVVSVSGYNDDGQNLASSLDIKYMNYVDAVNHVLQSESIVALLSDNEVMTICVVGPDGEQSSRILSDIEACTAENRNTYCYYAHSEEVQAAHDLGLSYGKYRTFLELQSLNPDVTVEQVQGMTIREIRDLINSLSSENGDEAPADSNDGYGHHGYGSDRGQNRK
jgi:hypothetical protein